MAHCGRPTRQDFLWHADGPQPLEEALTDHRFPRGCSPGLVRQFADGMAGEGQQIEDRWHRRQAFFAMTEVVFKIVAFGFQNVERFVFDLPPGAAGGGECGDVLAADLQVGDEAVAISRLTVGVANFNHQPIDVSAK
jgi:hypothetical protein